MSQLIKTSGFSNVAANGVASISLPLGRTYEVLYLILGGTALTKAMITDIQFKLNGKLFYRVTGSRLDAMNLYRGIANAAWANYASILPIDFTEPSFKDIVGMTIGEIAATAEAGLQNVTLEVTIAGATAPTLDCYVQISEPSANPVITRLNYLQQVIAGAVNFQPIYVPYGQNAGGQLKRVWIFHGGNTLGVYVKKNNVEIYNVDVSGSALMNWQANSRGKFPQANMIVYDPAYDNLTSNFVNTRGPSDADVTANPQLAAMRVNSFDFYVKTSAADTLNVYVEYNDNNNRV